MRYSMSAAGPHWASVWPEASIARPEAVEVRGVNSGETRATQYEAVEPPATIPTRAAEIFPDTTSCMPVGSEDAKLVAVKALATPPM